MATSVEQHPADRASRRPQAGLEVERGPDWLFVRVGNVGTGAGLTESVWETIREHGAPRVVLELDRVERVDEALGDAIAAIGARVRDAGGLIRICGLSPTKLSRLQRDGATGGVAHFNDRSAAVHARRIEAGSCE